MAAKQGGKAVGDKAVGDKAVGDKAVGDRAVHVVITSDSNTMGGMVALINSILTNTKALVFFHLVTDARSSTHLK